MTKDFEKRLLREKFIDTKLYRYCAKPRSGFDTQIEIKRILLEELDTTAALNDQSDTNPFGWEIVKVIDTTV